MIKIKIPQINYPIFYFLLGMGLLLPSCSKQWNLARIDEDNYRIDKRSAQNDSSVTDIILPYRSTLTAEMEQVLAKLDTELLKQKPEGTLGNWLADLLYTECTERFDPNIDFAIQNHGGQRVNSVAKGDITVGKMYEIMPFDNMIVILDLDGKTTKKLLDRIADYGGWPVSKQLRFDIADGQATNITVDNEPFDINKNYKVAIPDYVANGGDDCHFLREVPRSEPAVFIRDLMIEHAKKMGDNNLPLVTQLDGRIKHQ